VEGGGIGAGACREMMDGRGEFWEMPVKPVVGSGDGGDEGKKRRDFGDDAWKGAGTSGDFGWKRGDFGDDAWKGGTSGDFGWKRGDFGDGDSKRTVSVDVGWTGGRK
jgi:hypothetical protein